MSIIRPEKLPRWATDLLNNGPLGSPNRSEPSEIKKDQGFNHGERPSRNHWNYLQNLNYEFIDYFDKLWSTAGQINFHFNQDLSTTTGLVFGISAGTITFDGQESIIASTTLTMTANATTVIGFNLDALTISQYISGGEPTSDFVKLFVVTTNGSAITAVDDRRTPFQVQSRLQSGDNKLIIDGATDTLNYTNNGVSVLYADSSGNVGVNTATPLGKLHVRQNASGVSSVSPNANGVILEDNNSTGFTVATPNTQDGAFLFADPESDSAGGMTYLHGGDVLTLRTNDSAKLAINSSGNVSIASPATASPSGRLHIKDGSSGVTLGSNKDLVIESNASTVIQLMSPNTASPAIFFADPQANSAGGLEYSHGAGKMHLRVEDQNRVSLDSAGQMVIANASDTVTPLSKLHVKTGTSGASPISSDGIFVESAGGTHITIGTSATDIGSLNFADTGSNIVGAVQYDHSVDKLHLAASGANKVTVVGSSGNVGVGLSLPQGKVHVFQGESGVSSALTDADALVLEDSGSTGITIQTPNTASGNIRFVDPESNNAGSFSFNHVDNILSAQIEGVAKVNIGSATTTVTNDLAVTGNLTVNGTTTTINSTTVTVDDKNLEIGSVAVPTDVTADGGGITLKGATDKTINWTAATGDFDVSENWDLASGKSYKIDGSSVLTSTTLGSGVTASSLTSVGTLASLVVSGTEHVGGAAFIGATSGTALGKLHVKQGTSGVSSVYVSADDIVIEGSGSSGLSILTPNNSYGYLAFTDPDAVNPGLIEYDHTNNKMNLQTNSTSKLSISSAGKTVITTGSSEAVTALGQLHVRQAASGVTSISNQADGLVIEDSTHTGITICTPDSQAGNLVFLSPDGSAGQVQYDHSTNEMALFTSGSVKAKLNSVGLNIGTGAADAKLSVALTGTPGIGSITVTQVSDFAQGSRISLGAPLSNYNDGVFIGTNDGQVSAGIGIIRGTVGWETNLAFYTNNLTGQPQVDQIQEKMRIDHNGNVGINQSSPVVRLTSKSGTNGFPASSGTAQSAGALRLEGNDNAILDFGVNSSSGSWLQSTDKSNLGLNYPLLLNPNGGKVVIGDTTALAKLSIRENNASTTFTSTAYPAGISGVYSVNESNTDGSFNALTLTSRNATGTLQTASILSRSVTANLPPDMLFVTGENSSNTSSAKMILTSAGDLGVGTSAPLAKTHVKSGASNLTTAHTSGDELIVEGAGHTGITISTTSAFNGHLYFSDLANQNTEVGLIRYQHDTDTMDFWTAGTSAVSINNTQQLVVKTGTADSPGLCFNDSGTHVTGLYSSSDDVLNIACNSQRKFTISDSDFTFYRANGSPTALLRSQGNTIDIQGVGTTATDAGLTVSGSVACLGLRTNQLQSASRYFITAYTTTPSDLQFKVDSTGQIFSDASTSITLGADYAEMFEWLDGNPDNEDRRGFAVALVGEKIKIAEQGDNLIGVISSSPAIIGDSGDLSWKGKWLTDDFGTRLLDEEGNQQYSPEYDPEAEYIPRTKRKEWSPVGLTGKLVVRKGQMTAPNWFKMKDINENLELWLVK